MKTRVMELMKGGVEERREAGKTRETKETGKRKDKR